MTLIDVFSTEDVLCKECRNSLKKVERWVDVNGMKVYAYYEFDEKMSTLFHRYKEAHDQALGKLFLHPVHKTFDKQFKGKTIVCVPSSKKKREERGFMTLHMILGESRLVRVDVLEKLSDEKQSLRSAEKRREIKHEMNLTNPMLVEGKDILLFDDIVTTGSSMLACSGLLEKHTRSLTHVCIAIHLFFLKNEKKGWKPTKKQENKSAFKV